jgi:hypothetical protein
MGTRSGLAALEREKYLPCGGNRSSIHCLQSLMLLKANAALDMSKHYCLTVNSNSAIIFLSKQQICRLTPLLNLPPVYWHSSLTCKKGHSVRRLRHKHGGARRVTTSTLTSASWSLDRNPYAIIMVVGRNRRCLQ